MSNCSLNWTCVFWLGWGSRDQFALLLLHMRSLDYPQLPCNTSGRGTVIPVGGGAELGELLNEVEECINRISVEADRDLVDDNDLLLEAETLQYVIIILCQTCCHMKVIL